jgi:hypothetical protein
VAFESLEGLVQTPRTADELAHVVELAFDYRGDVTLVLKSGAERVGYLSNRDAGVAEPFVELLEPAASGPIAVPYADIQTIRFSGRDPAAGNSYAAWLDRKAAAKAAGQPPPRR